MDVFMGFTFCVDKGSVSEDREDAALLPCWDGPTED